MNVANNLITGVNAVDIHTIEYTYTNLNLVLLTLTMAIRCKYKVNKVEVR